MHVSFGPPAVKLQDTIGRTDDGQIIPVSWFGIASIHGAPFQRWDNAPPVQLAAVDKESNYCAHASDVFPTWHRAYLVLFEVWARFLNIILTFSCHFPHQQEVQKAATEIAQLYPTDQARWLDAAARLRIPYWDWVTHVIPPKEVLELTELIIETPLGLVTKRNPLFSYTFHDQERSSLPADWNTCTRRHRCVKA
jgi:tyrosinase